MSQNYTDNCYESTHSAQTNLQQMKDNFAALKSAFSDANSPANPIGGMWWLDTTTNILKLRNVVNTAWLNIWDMVNNKPIIANLSNEITGAMIVAAIKDPAAGAPGLRTLGTGAQQACAGNDPRLITGSYGTVITSSQTWNNSLNLRSVIVLAGGGGGGGGGIISYDNAPSGRGGNGGVAVGIIDTSSVTSVIVTIGAGGAAGAPGTYVGGTGGTTTFGSYITATGGTGGQPGQAVPGADGTDGTGTVSSPAVDTQLLWSTKRGRGGVAATSGTAGMILIMW